MKKSSGLLDRNGKEIFEGCRIRHFNIYQNYYTKNVYYGDSNDGKVIIQMGIFKIKYYKKYDRSTEELNDCTTWNSNRRIIELEVLTGR